MYDIPTYLNLISAFNTYSIIFIIAMAGLFLGLGIAFMILKTFKYLVE